MKAIILAAGYATRLYPLTIDKPKALLPIGGKPIIEYIVDDMNKIDEISTIYVVTNEKFYSHFADWAVNVKSNIPVVVFNDGTTDDTTKRGAIGDIQFTIEEGGIDEDVMIIAGDNFNTFSMENYYNYFKKIGKDCVCVMKIDDINQLKSFAVASTDENNKIVTLEEKPKEPKSDLAVFATYFYLKETLPLFKQYLCEGNTPDAPGNFPQWLHKKKDVYAYLMDGDCYDIGTPEMYASVSSRFIDGKFV